MQIKIMCSWSSASWGMLKDTGSLLGPLKFFLQRFATSSDQPPTFLQTPFKFSLNPKL